MNQTTISSNSARLGEVRLSVEVTAYGDGEPCHISWGITQLDGPSLGQTAEAARVITPAQLAAVGEVFAAAARAAGHTPTRDGFAQPWKL